MWHSIMVDWILCEPSEISVGHTTAGRKAKPLSGIYADPSKNGFLPYLEWNGYSGLNNRPQIYLVLIPENCKCYIIWGKVFMDVIKLRTLT